MNVSLARALSLPGDAGYSHRDTRELRRATAVKKESHNTCRKVENREFEGKEAVKFWDIGLVPFLNCHPRPHLMQL